MIRAWCAIVAFFGVLVAACGGSGQRRDGAGPSGSGGIDGASGGIGGSSALVGGAAGEPSGGASSGSGGTAGSQGGAAGTAGASGAPTLAPGPRPARIDKLDLLLMIDNSISMADKQAVLRDAVPILMRRLVTPLCLDRSGRLTGREVGANGTCSNGEIPEFEPIDDIHVAIVTSSLGAHGGDACDPAKDPTMDDRARPIGLVRSSLEGVGWDDTGFLAWDPGARKDPPGIADPNEIESTLADMVTAVGETGCGYEASLEAWYRFLIDPEPPLSIDTSKDDAGRPIQTITEGVDTALLDLRARFLRPDSLVVIVMLTDENDCSVVDKGQAWLVGSTVYGGQTLRMPRATSICDTDPNHECCVSCARPTPEGCSPDPACKENDGRLLAQEDSMNLRCYRQKQRFGFDFLHPISRYVDGLTQKTIRDSAGVRRENPLYAGSQRDASMVFLVGILGVPWPDVAAEESWPKNAPLRYLSYEELEEQGRFDWMLAPDATSFPADGLMYETPLDRTTIAGLPQTHPGLGAELAPSEPIGSPGPNPINGKETIIFGTEDLQYACIFPLPAPRSCTDGGNDCDCRPVDEHHNRAICDGTTQTHAKAYPSIRQIEVLRGVGRLNQNAILASICPKLADPEHKNDPSYGYTPAISALMERLRRGAGRSCLPTPLPVCNCDPTDEDACSDAICEQREPGQTDCAVLEAWLPPDGAACPPCDDDAELPGRKGPASDAIARAREQLELQGSCGGTTGVSCERACLCEIEQLAGDDLLTCQESLTTPMDVFGFCYVDPAQAATPELADAARAITGLCAEDERRVVRFTGKDLPAKHSTTLILCPNAAPEP